MPSRRDSTGRPRLSWQIIAAVLVGSGMGFEVRAAGYTVAEPSVETSFGQTTLIEPVDGTPGPLLCGWGDCDLAGRDYIVVAVTVESPSAAPAWLSIALMFTGGFGFGATPLGGGSIAGSGAPPSEIDLVDCLSDPVCQPIWPALPASITARWGDPLDQSVPSTTSTLIAVFESGSIADPDLAATIFSMLPPGGQLPPARALVALPPRVPVLGPGGRVAVAGLAFAAAWRFAMAGGRRRSSRSFSG
jgi:hypothetical protein